MKIIDFARIDEIRQVLVSHSAEIPYGDEVGDWRGPWQIEMAERLCAARRATLQAPAQWGGKTFNACLLGCAYLLAGYRVLVALPTLRQGSRVLIRRMDSWMEVLEKHYGIKRIRPDSTHEKTWENGAMLVALSADVSAKKGVQGYTFDLELIDEGHEIDPEVMIGPIFSRANIAMQKPHGKIIVLGVGGAKDSLIEHCKTLKDRSTGEHIFDVIHFDDTRVGSEYPPAAEQFRQDKDILSAESYAQFNQCAVISAGRRYVFHEVMERSIGISRSPIYAVGVDYGKWSDRTVALKTRVSQHVNQNFRHKCLDIEDFLELPKGLTDKEMAEMIYEWCAPFLPNIPRGHIAFETNQGRGMYEAFLELYPAASEFRIDDNETGTGLKSGLIDELVLLSQHKGLGCLDEWLRDHIAGLTYVIAGTESVSEDKITSQQQVWRGRRLWEHSDWFSALLGVQYVAGG